MAFNLLARPPRRALRALSVTMAGGALAGACGIGGPPALAAPAPAAERTADSAQEISLGALGLTAQPVFGPSGSAAVSMPAPMAPLAPSGSFLQIFFMHSPLLAAPGSAVTLSVNGAPVATLALDASSAEGATFEAPVPAFLLKGDGPNLVEARFVLRAPAGAIPSTTYARLDPQTRIHYQLLTPPGVRSVPGLQGYPFPFLGPGRLGRLGLVVPPLSSDGELGSAFRLAADLGRRDYLQEVVPQVVTAHQAEWLRSAATPALLVGTPARLPLADEVLRAAGFRPGVTWSGPAGEKIGDGDGLVVAAVSPWDGRTPVLLVSGRTEAALANATEALVDAGAPPPSGPYLIVPARGAGPATRRPARPAPQVALFGRRPEDGAPLEALGEGAHAVSFPFVLPAVAADRPGLLELQLSHAPVDSAGASSLSIQLNGAAFAQVPLNAGNQQDATVRVRPGGALFRPGLNLLTLSFRLAAVASNDDSAALQQWARLGPGIRLVTPPPPSGEARLESLPGRIFDGPGSLLVVVEHRDDAWLSAAARALAALGSRSTEVPLLEVASPGEVPSSGLGERSAIAIGAGAVAAVDRRWRPASQLRGSGSGTVYQRSLAEVPARGLLCVATGAPEVVAAAAAAVYGHTLRGPAVGLDATGASWPVRSDPPAAPSGVDTTLALRVLFALAIAAMLAAVAGQVLRPGEASP